ncbi:MAG TPA: DUF1592 domain-containing protein [Bryobacteraceae bacterium]|nr:DUF1592 domain-containing protein [Bryobacteraceae bacterium]
MAMRWFFLSFLPLYAAGADAPFGKTLYPVLKQAACQSCHNSAGVASATRLQFPDNSATAEQVEAFGRSLAAFVNRDQPAKSALLNKPTNRVAHTGGERIKPGSPEEALLKKWIERLTQLTGEDLLAALRYKEDLHASSKPAPPVLRRLTHSQYNNTVRDLLSELSQPADQLPPEDFVNGFKNQYQAQSLSPMLFEAYSATAEKLVRSFFRRGDIEQVIPCKPSRTCRSEFVRSFGLKAFRRPLTAAEQTRYEALISEKDFLAGARTVMEAMLQSPHFLFQLDETPDASLKPYAAASRLSYTLWNTMPDAALLESARKGELSNPAGFERVARRMLEDAKAKEGIDDFVSQWLRFDRVITSGRDSRLYPGFSRTTAVAMTEETRRFVADLVWRDRDFTELFTDEFAYVNPELALLYGVKAPENEFERVPFAADSERAGLLGQALFLTLTANPSDTSPTARGLFVREHFLCQHVADPPPGVSTNLPPLTQTKPQTNRERLGMHVSDKSCAACHNVIDPIGFGFEKFDAIGRRREKAKLVFYPLDRKSKEPPKTLELDLDTSGWIAGIPKSNFSSPRELGAILARTPQCQECVVKQYFRYAAGRPETNADRPLIQKVYEDFKGSKFRFKDLVTSMMLVREFPRSAVVTTVTRRSAP